MKAPRVEGSGKRWERQGACGYLETSVGRQGMACQRNGLRPRREGGRVTLSKGEANGDGIPHAGPGLAWPDNGSWLPTGPGLRRLISGPPRG